MHFNALSKRVTPQNVKSIFRYNISSKQLIYFRYNGKPCSLANQKEIFHIGGEGRNLTPRPLYGTFPMVHSKYVVETLFFVLGNTNALSPQCIRIFFILFRVMHLNALSKRVMPQNVKSIFRYNISSKQLIFF